VLALIFLLCLFYSMSACGLWSVLLMPKTVRPLVNPAPDLGLQIYIFFTVTSIVLALVGSSTYLLLKRAREAESAEADTSLSVLPVALIFIILTVLSTIFYIYLAGITYVLY